MPDGLTTPAGNKIEGEVNGTILPGDYKILKMPTTAVRPGRYTVQARVVTAAGEGSATTSIDWQCGQRSFLPAGTGLAGRS